MTDSSAPASSVSIVIPTLNEEENIEPLISQITACAVPFLEILFVDDHSTDNTRGKIHDLARTQPIRLIEQDGADLGLAGAIMSGARAAQGEILHVGRPRCARRHSSRDGCGPESSARPNQRAVGTVICGHCRFGSWEPICKRRVHTRVAHLAADRVPNRCRPRLSIDRPARFDVRLLCYWPFPAAGLGTANQRFQNCLRDDRARWRNAARTRNSHRFSRTRTREIENVIQRCAAISFPLAARDVPAPDPQPAASRTARKTDNQQWRHKPRKFSRIEVICSQSPHITRPQESNADASRHTRLELSPSTTTITSLPGRVPLAIKHLPAASV